MTDAPKTTNLPFGFNTPDTEIIGTPGVGLDIYVKGAQVWLSWDETVALAKWLATVVEEAP